MRFSRIATGSFALFVLGCSFAAPPDPELIASLRDELNTVEKEIHAAQAEDAKYAGGLVKSLIRIRLELLKTSQELIRQRIHSLETGAPVTITVAASKPDQELANRLKAELLVQKKKVDEAKAYSDRYSGGLVKAMAESNVATASTTLAMIDQRRLIAEYGLGFPALPTPDSAASPPRSAPIPTDDNAGNIQDEIVTARLLKKRFAKQDYQDYIFFDIEFNAQGLDKPARAIKGVLHLQDLFGEARMHVRWTIDEPIQPGQTFEERGTGFEYNQFTDSHQWVRATDIENMTASFTVESILYADGSRHDF
ncbi:MAG: hypothetical protein P8Y94_07830 [Acidobacteriota bacterium]